MAQLLYLHLGEDMEVNIFDDLYQNVRTQIASLAPTQEAKTMVAAQSLLSTESFKAVLAVDGGVAMKKNTAVAKQLASYAAGGGTVLFCCMFSSFVRPPDMDKMWQKFDQPWRSGDYHRTTFYLNKRMKNVLGSQRAVSLSREYSMKALHLQDVPAGSRAYVPLEHSRTQSRVWPPDAVDDTQTPAVFHKYGDGWLGYIGDVNNEKGTRGLLMAMLDFAVSSTNTPPPVAAVEPSPGDSNPGCFVCEKLTPVKKCGRCHKRQYCSIECQREDWQGHKHMCPFPRPLPPNVVVSPMHPQED